MPKWEKQQAVYKSAIITEIDPKYSKSSKKDKEEPQHYPYEKSVDELNYERWVENVTNSKNQFNPQKDDDNRSIPDTGAYLTVKSITRIRRADGSEWLTTKSDLHGFDALGDEVRLFLSQPERWQKTIFSYKTEWNERTKQLEKVLQGTKDVELIYEIPFSKQAAKELYDQRESDQTIYFTVKEETSDKVRKVEDVCTAKEFELFRDLSFEDLKNANYMSSAVKAELRQEAVSAGLIGGTIGTTLILR